MKMPYIKFYIRDWQSDPELRMCSLSARGLWIEMLCIMQNAKRRGYLESPLGEPINDDMLSRLIGTDKGDLYTYRDELVKLGVTSIEAETGIMYCRRMVKDASKSEKCARAARNGGGNPSLRTSLPEYNIQKPETRNHISLKATFKGASTASLSKVEEVLNCRPEFAGLDPAPFFQALHNAKDNPRLDENHAEFIANMANSLELPKVPVRTYANYLNSAGKPGSDEAGSSQETVFKPKKRPKFD